MERYAIVWCVDGTVLDIIDWDEEQNGPLQGDAVKLDDGSPVDVGWRYSDGAWVEPDEEPAALFQATEEQSDGNYGGSA